VAPPRSAFEYAVIRVVPDIEREEFVNAGLIVFSRPHAYLRAATHINEDAVNRIRAGCDLEGIRGQLRFIEEVAAGTTSAAPFGAMDQSGRFHWLTAPRSTLVQPGPIHAGVTEDPAATFEHLYDRLVGR